MAGKTISLPGATLRSIDLTIVGSGFGSASMEKIFAAIPQLVLAGRRREAEDRRGAGSTGGRRSRLEPVEKGRRIVFTV